MPTPCFSGPLRELGPSPLPEVGQAFQPVMLKREKWKIYSVKSLSSLCAETARRSDPRS